MPGLFETRFTHWDILVYFAAVVAIVVLTRIFAPRQYDTVVAIFSVGSFIAFLLVVEVWVESLSLRIILIISALMAAYDFWLDIKAARKNENGKGSSH